MCGRYYRRSDKQRIADAFELGTLPDDFVLPDWDYNVAPATFQPVIRDRKDSAERELVLMRWGLVPFFTKQLVDVKGLSTINAKAESVAAGATWRAPFQKRRCLVPADGFYEWQKLDPKSRQPFAFQMADGHPFAFAGLWDAWKDPTGGWLLSFSIITTRANKLMSPVHDRMPVILHPRDYARWLRRDLEGPEELLRPFDSDMMQSWAVTKDVGNVRNNGPELLKPPQERDSPGLFSN